MLNEPIDAVITWVDGHDKAHQEKLQKVLVHYPNRSSEAASSTRFNQVGEINFCIKSVMKCLPWINTIYVVTDNQIPPIVSNLPTEKIKVIDHKILFSGFEENLPTFNSLSIESLLWRIPHLSSKFIYLNDDCFILNKLKPEDFFSNDKIILRGEWKRPAEKRLINRIKTTFLKKTKLPDKHRLLQERTAQLVGLNKYFFHLPHCPFPLHKETFQSFFEEHASLLKNNIQYQLRDDKQFWPISLATHLEIIKKKVILRKSSETIMINPLIHSLKKIKYRLSQKKFNHFLCLQSLDLAPLEIQGLLLQWLDEEIGSF